MFSFHFLSFHRFFVCCFVSELHVFRDSCDHHFHENDIFSVDAAILIEIIISVERCSVDQVVQKLFQVPGRFRNRRRGVIGIKDDIDTVVFIDVFEHICVDCADVDPVNDD